ncbi:hypothetical protein [Streptomyces sp. NPDC058305]|uniref:hypothetical protein n=1 Tax=Streptomyces sp. NPDC058305 TaxID=3346438 RepID=UPI0036E253E6
MTAELIATWFAIAVLGALMATAIAVALTRADGRSWPAALKCGGATFARALTLVVLVLGLVLTR